MAGEHLHVIWVPLTSDVEVKYACALEVMNKYTIVHMVGMHLTTITQQHLQSRVRVIHVLGARWLPDLCRRKWFKERRPKRTRGFPAVHPLVSAVGEEGEPTRTLEGVKS